MKDPSLEYWGTGVGDRTPDPVLPTDKLQSIRERWGAQAGPWKATFDRYEGASDRGREIEDRNDDTPAFRKALKTGDIIELWTVDEIDACELAPEVAKTIASAPDDIAYLLRLAEAGDALAEAVEHEWEDAGVWGLVIGPVRDAVGSWRRVREG